MKRFYFVLIILFSVFTLNDNVDATEYSDYNSLGLTNIGKEVPFKVNSNRNSYYNTEDGYIYAFGSNLQGNFGTGDIVSLTSPERLGNGLEELRYARDWSLGIDFSCVIDTDGYLWVAANQGISTSKYTFTKVTDVDASRLLKVEAAYGRAYMINEDGILYYGNQNTYTEVVNNSGLSIIDFCTVGSTNSATNDAAYAIMSDGSLFFSDNGKQLQDTNIRNIKTIDGDAKSEEIIVTTNSGQLYQGTAVNLKEVELPDINDAKIIRVAQGTNYEGLLTSDGQVYLRGVNANGKFGNSIPNGTYNTWQLGESDVSYFDIGFAHSMYLKNDKKVYGAGINEYGQLGTGATGVDQSLAIFSDVVNNSGVVLPEAPKEHSELPDITPTLISNNKEVSNIEFSNSFSLKENEIDLNNELYTDYDIKVIITGSKEDFFIVNNINDVSNSDNFPKEVGSYNIKYQLVYKASGKVVSETKNTSITIEAKSVELVATDKLNQYLTYINEDYSIDDIKEKIISGVNSGIYLEEFTLYKLEDNILTKVNLEDLNVIVNITNNNGIYNAKITLNQYGYNFNTISKDFELITNKTLGDNCVSFYTDKLVNEISFTDDYVLMVDNPNNYNVLVTIENDNFNETFYLKDINDYNFKLAGTYTIYTSVVEYVGDNLAIHEETKSVLIIKQIELEIKSDNDKLVLSSKENMDENIEMFINQNYKLYQNDALFLNYTTIINNEFVLSNYNFSYIINEVSTNNYNVVITLEDTNYSVQSVNFAVEIEEVIVEDELDNDDSDMNSNSTNYILYIILGVIAGVFSALGLGIFIKFKR